MSESISILINAEDVASAKLRAVGQNVEQLGTKVRATSNNLKGGVMLAGTFANAFGGGAFGAFAGELGQISERVSAFSEVSKAGKVGALAFKAALAGAVAVTAFKVGEAIGNWAFETQRWKDELKAAGTEAERLNGIMDKRRQKAFAEAREDISLERNPADREKATEQRMAALQKEAKGLEVRLGLAEKEVAERKATNDAAYFKGNSSEELKMAEESLKRLKQNKQALDEERAALGDTISERAKSIEAKKAENALADKSDAFIQGLRDEVELLKATKEEQLKLEAARNTTPAARGVAEELLKEREALRSKAEEQKKVEAETELAARKEADAIERASQLEKKRTVDLEARRIELEKGREAAAAYRLEQDGLSKATAERLAAAEEQQKQFEETASKAKNLDADNSPQTALQGRFLRGGTGGDPMLAAANKTVASLEKLNTQLGAKLDKLYAVQRERGFTVKTVNVP